MPRLAPMAVPSAFGAAVASADPTPLDTTTLNPPIPAGATGWQAGDTLICFTASNHPGPTVATPAGWTEILNVTGTYGRLVLFAKVAVGSESAPNVVWSSVQQAGAGAVQARIAAFRNLDNADLASMVEVVGTIGNNGPAANSSTGGVGITTLSDHSMVMTLTTRQDDVGTANNGSGGSTLVTPLFGTTSGPDFAMGWSWQRKAVPAATGTITIGLTGAVSAASTGVTLALKAKVAPWTTYKELILATYGVIGYWRLGDPAGTKADSGSNALHATTVAGALTHQVPGLISGDVDRALRSDGGVGSYIGVPYNALLNPSLLSFECWFTIESYTAGKRFVSRGNNYLSQGSQTNYALVCKDTSNAISVVSPSGSLKVGSRQHLVGVFGGGSAGMRLYVNGIDVGGSPSFTPVAFLSQTDVTNPLNMFAADAASGGIVGTMDEVVYYDRQLTPTEILEHFVAGSGSSDNPTGRIALTGSCSEYSNAPASYYDTPSGRMALSGYTDSVGVAPFAWGAAVRELPPLRHHVDAIAPNGRHYRWAGDEPDAQNVPGNLRWGSTMPGGYESMDCVLPRRPGADYADLERLTTLRVISNGGSVVGEYRLERTPQTSGDQMSISPSAVGWQAHLDDQKGVSVVFIDRELGSWIGANSQRQLAELNSGHDPVDAGSTPGDDGMPSLKLSQQGGWQRRWNCESYYFFPTGDAAGRVKFDYVAAPTVSIADANWVADAYAVTADGYSGFTQLTPTDWLAAQSGSVDITAAAVTDAARRALMLRLYYATGPAGTDNTAYDLYLRLMRVFGNHNLPLRGADALREGFNASDMIAYALRKWCPLIKVAAPGADGDESVQQTDFIIPQAKFLDTTTSEIVRQLTRYGLEDWAVWNDKTFYLSRRNANPLARKWRARIGPARLEETGKQADRLWESIIVQFNDVDGSSKTVGPPGSGADVESAYLKDDDPDNPANKLGMTRRDKLVMGVSTFNGAIEVGRRFLEEQKLIDRSGRATLVGHVMDSHGVLWPYSAVQAGDQILFIDAADTSYRRIVKADHDERSKSVSVDLDAPPEGLQAVLERLAVVLVPLGL
jgi:hypothetical protein